MFLKPMPRRQIDEKCTATLSIKDHLFFFIDLWHDFHCMGSGFSNFAFDFYLNISGRFPSVSQ